jgi:hypothetical protein
MSKNITPDYDTNDLAEFAKLITLTDFSQIKREYEDLDNREKTLQKTLDQVKAQKKEVFLKFLAIKNSAKTLPNELTELLQLTSKSDEDFNPEE